MGFSTPSYPLNDLFARIDRGDIQLPDFQRDYAWDVDRIRSLITTVLRGFPVGVLMALDTRGEEMRFRPRALSGAPDTGKDPGLLLLDGQQRLTTLYHCFSGDGYVNTVDFRSKKVTRKFYIDVAKAVESPVMSDEAIFSVDETGKIISHFGPVIDGGITDLETALAHGCLPVSVLLDDNGTDFLFDLADMAGEGAREHAKRFQSQIVKTLVSYDIPMIRLDRETAKGGIGSIFAQANSSGLQMDVFDLLTAVFAADESVETEFSLRDDWVRVERNLRQHSALDGIGSTQFLTAVALLVSARKGHASGYREDILNLTLAEYIPAADEMIKGFDEAAEFLRQRCILSLDQVPYTAQIVPLAVILTLLDAEEMATARSWDRLNQWFWSGVLGELYGSPAVIARSGRDTDQVAAWIREGAGETAVVPKTIRDTVFHESRLLSATQDTGVWKGIFALLMGRGARDWRTGQQFDRWTFDELGCNFHQIFPTKWCKERGIDPVLTESVLNRTPMGRRTEVVIGDTPPSRYLSRVQSKSLMGDEEFDQMLDTHLLSAEDLHSSNTTHFFASRRTNFIDMVEDAIGKAVIRDVNESDLTGGHDGPDAFGDAAEE
ncbi:hypothetical protein CGLAR1_06755 [Corynebacterium glutamicum]|uniref:GmrSD restriction endonuclease domain-containing protein n=1 Tax=Corynebacterium glutamicum TaxID=1718 RepID=UPI0004F73FCC|nr:DUF262 domain-containing protein [Corynebacterium glutamicum]AIK84962.1 hypothetical protein CGLAR1_06755 [Corynebacterium glutamicum]AIK87746.1 hypothetical protein AR0_06890 [Corynebacterium glutamicum]QDQ20748.1 DUF262 domain-containing protein [Corynebacterium glutamicum]QDQ24318.1 DUF262 domain-containing protein [Corynebacterium glutamicum]